MEQRTDGINARLNELAVRYKAESASKGGSKMRRNECFMELYALVMKQNGIHQRSDLSPSLDEVEAEAFHVALINALKGFDPEKGQFMHYFNKLYGYSKKDAGPKPYNCISILDDVDAHEGPGMQYAVVGTIGLGPEYRVHAIVEPEGEQWFKIRVTLHGDRKFAYVRKSERVSFIHYTTESLNGENSEGETFEKNVSQPQDDMYEDRIGDVIDRDAMDDIMRMVCGTVREVYGDKPDKQGVLTQGQCYRMFFTEDVIGGLQEGNNRYIHSFRNEPMVLELMDNSWMDYLMTRRCRSFRQIVTTRRNDYDHYLHDGRHDEISLPPEIRIRCGYIENELHVENTSSLASRISRVRSKYELQMQCGLQAAMHKDKQPPESGGRGK